MKQVPLDFNLVCSSKIIYISKNTHTLDKWSFLEIFIGHKMVAWVIRDSVKMTHNFDCIYIFIQEVNYLNFQINVYHYIEIVLTISNGKVIEHSK